MSKRACGVGGGENQPRRKAACAVPAFSEDNVRACLWLIRSYQQPTVVLLKVDHP